MSFRFRTHDSTRARVGVVVLVDRVGGTTSLSQNTTNIDVLLSLFLNGLSFGSLLSLLAVQIALQTWLSTTSTRFVVHGLGNSAFTRCCHLLGVELIATAYVFVGQALGFFASASTSDTSGYGSRSCFFLRGGLLGGDALVAGVRISDWRT